MTTRSKWGEAMKEFRAGLVESREGFQEEGPRLPRASLSTSAADGRERTIKTSPILSIAGHRLGGYDLDGNLIRDFATTLPLLLP